MMILHLNEPEKLTKNDYSRWVKGSQLKIQGQLRTRSRVRQISTSSWEWNGLLPRMSMSDQCPDKSRFRAHYRQDKESL